MLLTFWPINPLPRTFDHGDKMLVGPAPTVTLVANSPATPSGVQGGRLDGIP